MMLPVVSFVFVGAAEVQQVFNTSAPIDPGLLIVIGTLVVLSLGVFIWAAFYRKTKRRSHRHHHHHRHHRKRTPSKPASPETAERTPDSTEFSRRHRRRRRRRPERPRNPTLAETGGLPPLRGAPPETPPSV